MDRVNRNTDSSKGNVEKKKGRKENETQRTMPLMHTKTHTQEHNNVLKNK